MAARIEILRKKAPPPGPPNLKDRLMAELARLLPAHTVALAMPEERQGIPGILIIHRGRALGLEPARPGAHLSDLQRAMFPRLRAAGMRIEVARSFAEALAQLREMGLALEGGESLTRQVAELFRASQSQRGGRL